MLQLCTTYPDIKYAVQIVYDLATDTHSETAMNHILFIEINRFTGLWK